MASRVTLSCSLRAGAVPRRFFARVYVSSCVITSLTSTETGVFMTALSLLLDVFSTKYLAMVASGCSLIEAFWHAVTSVSVLNEKLPLINVLAHASASTSVSYCPMQSMPCRSLK